ncbi:hypothetical protein DK847_14615 [Aestuariivirga litoralis]|uniref:Uncharacterized protein n=1 Tax=Aestuariivirga litoralis TaxID=2650924 RepID=A0A2W2ALH1_9HYPH|nr:hypothetical protein [Aestuariivirga litoralis]PZF76405.1 hypothetical protein DK847_14615 [Aestuariivirga litoralis]
MMIKRIGLLAFTTLTLGLAVELGGHVLAPGKLGMVSEAQAIVGRPLTPVSVAGVARRTVRRCAVGVYYC